MGVKDEQQFNRRPARAGRTPVPTRGRADSEFINLELDKEQTAAYREWRLDVENVFDLWTELIEGGYRVNTKYDDYSSSCATFIIPDDGSDNVGFLLTGRGGNAYRALSEAIYKHFEILKGVWGNYSPSDKPGRDSEF